MASAAHTNIEHGLGQPTTLSSLAFPFAMLWSGLGSIATATRQAKEIDRLSAMNDSQLKARGIRREDIGRHVLGF